MEAGFQRLSKALSDRYSVERELGRGGMAVVYLAYDRRNSRRVAIKVLDPDLAGGDVSDRFVREMEIAARLTHPHILPLHDSGTAHGFLYYVMPYIEGESLRDRLARERQLPIDDALGITRDVASALHYAHEQGVVHRDIKPANILLTAGGAVVSDFGIARALEEAGGERLTKTGIAIGTPAYMSPEQTDGSVQLDGRSDQYSLGCVLFEMLAGEPPFPGSSARVILTRHALDSAPPIRSARPTVPDAVEHALNKALAKVPADRFVTLAEFARALAVSGAIPTADTTLPAASVSRTPVFGRPRAWMVVAAAAALAVTVILGVRESEPVTATVDPVAIAVLPFRVSNQELGHVETDLAELLQPLFSTQGVGPDAATVLSRWTAARTRTAGELSEAEEIAIGLEVGAAWVLRGSVVGGPARLTLNAALQDRGGRVGGRGTVTGPLDSLRHLGLQLAAQLISPFEPRPDRLAQADARTLEAYVAGHVARIRLDWPEAIDRFREARRLDPNFASAVFELSWALTYGGYRGSEVVFEARRATSAARDSLSDRERTYDIVAYGPQGYGSRYTPEERLTVTNSEVRRSPDRFELWRALALRLQAVGPALGIKEPELSRRIVNAFDTAVALLPIPAANPGILSERFLAALNSSVVDTATIRRFGREWVEVERRSLGEQQYARWLVAQATADEPELQRLRRSSDEWQVDSGDMLAMSISHGFSLDDAELAFAAEQARATTERDRQNALVFRSQVAVLRGQAIQSAALLDTLTRLRPRVPGVWWYISVPIRRALVEPSWISLARPFAQQLFARQDTANPPEWGAAMDNPVDRHCTRGIWRWIEGDTTATLRHTRELRQLRAQRDADRPNLCAHLLDALVESVRALGPDDPRPALEALDVVGAEIGVGQDPGELTNLVVARLLAQRGDTVAAYDAIRRRRAGLHGIVYWQYLIEEGRLALAVGDTGQAIQSFSHYLRLRTDPDSTALPDWEYAQAQLEKLIAR